MKLKAIALGLGALLLVGGGCQQGNDQNTAGRTLKPADFGRSQSETNSNPSQAAAPVATQASSAVLATVADPPAAVAVEPPPPVEAPANYTPSAPHVVDAMVGQVNGEPIFARMIFTDDVEQTIERLGRTQAPLRFQREAAQLINGKLVPLVYERLVLAEAERNLNERQQLYLTRALREYREELIRLWGLGAEQRAEVTIKSTQGITLDEAVERERQKRVVMNYLGSMLASKIQVTRRDIDRYYQAHYDEYNPPAKRTLRLIRAHSDSGAKTIRRQLRDGDSFVDVARDEQLNANNPQQGGLIEATTLRWAQLNEAIERLAVGEHSDAITVDERVWWVYIESIDQPPGKPLFEVQLDIKRKLRLEQQQYFQHDYQQKLFTNGNYTPVEEMADKLLEIAISRYQKGP